LFSRFILAYRVLAGNLKPGNTPNQMKPPPNVRVLIASRPLGDIYKSLHAALHVRCVSMDDTVHVSIESSERDIQCYISTLLEDVEGFNDGDFKRLASKSDGLFEWVRLIYFDSPMITSGYKSWCVPFSFYCLSF